jgi:hypothetical protein
LKPFWYTITGTISQNPLNTIRNRIHGDHGMATLNSPGVSVTVIDESFYTPAAPGTTPLLIVASAENKANGSNTGTAPATLAANAGKVYLMTSQKDLADNFGTPVFKTDANNNPIHAGEQNEYGLQAAYSYLGVSNRAYIVRADINLDQLDASAEAPAGAPVDGQYWLDTSNSKYGIFQWNSAAAQLTNGQTFANKVPTVISDVNKLDNSNGWAPKASVGAVGDYAITVHEGVYGLFLKKGKTSTPAGTWVLVGSSDWVASWAAVQGTTPTNSVSISSGMMFTLTVDGDDFNYTGYSSLSYLITAINAQTSTHGVSAADVNNRLELYTTGMDFDLSDDGWDAVGIDTGTYLAPKTQISPHTSVPTFKRTDNTGSVQGYPTGSLWIKTTEPNLGARWRVKIYNEATASWIEKSAPIYATGPAALKGLDSTGGGINLSQGTLFVKSNFEEDADPKGNFKIFARRQAGALEITSPSSPSFSGSESTLTFTIQETVKGKTEFSDSLSVSFARSGGVDAMIAALSAKLAETTYGNTPFTSRVTTYKTTTGKVAIRHEDGGEIKLADVTGTPIADLFTPYDPSIPSSTVDFYAVANSSAFVATLWSPYADITASAVAPTTEPEDGRLWYNSLVDEVDLLINTGSKWVGFLTAEGLAINNPTGTYGTTDANGPIVSATKPKTQSDGVTPLANGDIWIDTSDIENYPQIYKYNKGLTKWVSVDTADQTTESGIIFHDARWGVDGGTVDGPTNSTIQELLESDFVDVDAPDPALYPTGILLWNLRRSGFNVKRFVRNFVDVNANNIRYNDYAMTDYYPHRWVTESSNQDNGAGTFGRKAQRKVVVQALQALVNSNQQIRDEESRIFNLIACPGYPELIGELVGLNYDRGLTAFVVGDTPARLHADATSLNNWGKNVAGAVEDNDDGLVSSDEYLGIFYPWGYTSDNFGNNIVVPPSHMMLRTIALSDQVSYPWFAPAGTRRGGVTNATAVGYITNEGEFQSVALNTGQRDTLADSKVNPITFITGTGLVNYGQYTRAKNASSLDRINVARLVIYLRRQFALLAKPYVFEPNDKITRDELKGAAESLLLELVGQRAIYDYIVVCDTSNNTPARIDRNELYLDVAIEPVKAVEFIYIPLRLKNTGEIAGLTQ